VQAAPGNNSVLPREASRQMAGRLEQIFSPACRHTPAAPFAEHPVRTGDVKDLTSS